MPDAEGFSYAVLWAHNDSRRDGLLCHHGASRAGDRPHHTRMPVILPTETYRAWLDTDLKGDDAKALLLGSQIDSLLTFHGVTLKKWIRGDDPDSALWVSSDGADKFGHSGRGKAG